MKFTLLILHIALATGTLSQEDITQILGTITVEVTTTLESSAQIGMTTPLETPTSTQALVQSSLEGVHEVAANTAEPYLKKRKGTSPSHTTTHTATPTATKKSQAPASGTDIEFLVPMLGWIFVGAIVWEFMEAW